MTDKRIWITDRLPTEADADEDGDVIACTTPRLCIDFFLYEKWHDVTPGWPWRHSQLWTPPTPAPEPAPAAPEADPEPEPEPEKAVRGFLAFTRVENEYGFTDSAVATDNTAWVRFYGINHPTSGWMAITPLPQPGEE